MTAEPAATACPSNLHMTVSCRWSGLPKLSERVEQKFFILPQRENLAFALLRRTCREDPEFAVGQVNSLYFDTPDLDQHQRSDAGEYNKDKIRIRWYGEECDPHRVGYTPPIDQAMRVWIERKSRFGFASTKQRTCMTVPASRLAHNRLPQGIISPTVLMHTIAGFGFFTYAPLVPVIAISYWRYRFVEPETGFRISIDSHIRSSMVMPGIGRGERALELPGAIVEVKGARFEVPRSLREIAEIGSTWTRYSKYSGSIEAHESRNGSVSRLWPNGMMEATPGRLCPVRLEADEPGPSGKTQFVEEFETE
jgi:hypothetical protein